MCLVKKLGNEMGKKDVRDTLRNICVTRYDNADVRAKCQARVDLMITGFIKPNYAKKAEVLCSNFFDLCMKDDESVGVVDYKPRCEVEAI